MIVSIAIILWITQKIDFVELKKTFAHFEKKWLIILAIIYLSTFLLRGLRAKIMLRPIKSISFSMSTAIVSIGFMANNLLPARLGELVRAFVLNRREGISKATAISSIIVERVFDGLALLLIFGLSSKANNICGEYQSIINRVGFLAGTIFIICFLLIIIFRVKPSLLEYILVTSRILPQKIQNVIISILHSISDSLQFLKFDLRFLLFLFLNILIWLTEGSMYLVGLYAFGLPLDPKIAYFSLALINFGLLLPSAPGYIGLFQASTILAFAAFGLEKEIALSYSMVIHAIQFSTISIVGLSCLNLMNISFKDVRTIST